MSSVSISISVKEIERAEKILAGVNGGIRSAVRAALVRTTDAVKTRTLEEIEKVYNIKRFDVRGQSQIYSRLYDGKDGVVGHIVFAGTKLPLMRYSVTPSVPRTTKRRVSVEINGLWKTVHASEPVRASLKKGSSLTGSESAFVAQMKSGHIGVFDRVGSSVTERKGLSVAHMAQDAGVLEAVEEYAQETFEKHIDHEINRVLAGIGV